MTINKIKNTGRLLLLVSLLFNSGCKKFLDETDPSNLTPDVYYTIPEHAEAAIGSVYAQTRVMTDGAGIFSNNWQMLDAPTGIQYTETAQNSDLNNLYALTYDGSNLHINQNWNGWYRVIAQANLVLDKVPGINPMDAAQKKRILGEASFLRAWAYFYLVRLWGDVPLILLPQTATSEDFFPARATTEMVYKQITDDLTLAEAAGLPWMDASGRASTAAIKSELAKVYLTMAGQPLNKGVAYYKLAADKAKEVIDYANSNPGSINLFPTYTALHTASNDNKLENIFSIQYNDAAGSGNPLQSIYLPLHKPVSSIDGIGTSVPTLEFYNSFEANDLRHKNRVGFFFTDYYLNGSEATLYDPGNPHIFKYFDFIANGVLGTRGTNRSDLNITLIRYAEVLLIFAEAQNEVGGPTQAAYDALKRIRDRAELVTPALGTYSQVTFREAVWRERWYELCFEGITWFDMIRLRKIFNETTKGFDNFAGHAIPYNGKVFDQKRLLFPLPTSEMQNNVNLKPQNPGY